MIRMKMKELNRTTLTPPNCQKTCIKASALFTADNPGRQLLRRPWPGVPVLQGLRGLGDGRDHLDGVVPERRPGLPLHLPHHPPPPLRPTGVRRGPAISRSHHGQRFGPHALLG